MPAVPVSLSPATLIANASYREFCLPSARS